MITWCRELFEKHREILVYLIFGVLTTIVNWAVHIPLYNYLGLSATVSTAIAWVVSVIFAFLTNKPIVFQSKDWSLKVAGPEFLKFVGCRVGSGVLELVSIMVTVDILHFNGTIMKIIVSVFVVIINYVGSKLLFKNKS